VLEIIDGIAGGGAMAGDTTVVDGTLGGIVWRLFGGALRGSGAGSAGTGVGGDKCAPAALPTVPAASGDPLGSPAAVAAVAVAAAVVFLRLEGAGFVTRRLRPFAGARTTGAAAGSGVGFGAVVIRAAIVCVRRGIGKGSTRRGGRSDGGGAWNGSGERSGGPATGGRAVAGEVTGGEGSGARGIGCCSRENGGGRGWGVAGWE
jgi:hypothetical protein